MVAAMLFLVIILRAIIESVFWLLVGRTLLSLLAGKRGSDNAILGFFDACLKPPRMLFGWLFPRCGGAMRDIGLFVGLVFLWIGLGLCKWWLVK